MTTQPEALRLAEQAAEQAVIPPAFAHAASQQMAVTSEWCRGWDACRAHILSAAPAAEQAEPYTYASTQSTKCASCGERKHTPLRIDAMGGYVCLTCIDKKLGSLLGEFGHPAAEQAEPVAPHLSYPHITQPYTLEEIRAQIASHDYSAELLLQHAMLLLEAAEQAAPVTAMIGKCQQCGHEHEIPPAPAAAEQAEPVARWQNRPKSVAERKAEVAAMVAIARRAGVAVDADEFGRGTYLFSSVDTLERLIAAPPAPARQEWQPIETAPMDGTPLLAYRERDGKIAVAYRVPRNDFEAWYFGGACAAERFFPGHRPSHWQPLPAAPITAAPAEGGA